MRRLTLLLRSTTVLALVLIAAGCSSTIELSPENRQQIRLVHVSKDVPEQASISGHLAEIHTATRGGLWFSSLLTAPVGIVLAVLDWSDDEEQSSIRFRSFLEKSDVDVPHLARSRFLRHVANAKVFDSIYTEPGQGTFELQIEHGLSNGLGWRGSWKPWVTAVGSLVDREGKVVWRHQATISEHDARVPEVSHPARQEKFLQRAYARAVDLVTQELVDHLVGA